MRFPSFALDPLSYLVGFITATIFWWLMGRIRPVLKEMREGWRERREEAKAQRSSGTEDNHRRTTLRRAQGMHLAAPLFALDEIIEIPHFLAPPAQVDPDSLPFTEDIVTRTIPYLPFWPELAGFYQAATLDIPRAVESGHNLIITGHAGAGKTVALAYLATLAANRDPKMGNLSNHIPFIYHLADLQIPEGETKDLLKPIIDAASVDASVFDIGRLPKFLDYAFSSGRALFLLDGFDELHPDEQPTVTDYLKGLSESYPDIIIITTGCPDQLDGLVEIGFEPMALIAWTPGQRQTFIHRWGKLWMNTIAVEAWAQGDLEQIDPLLMDTWLGGENQTLSPLELTLKIWAGYAGDLIGPGIQDALSAHVRRLAPKGTPIAALETLGMQVTLSTQSVFEPRSARQWVKKFELPEEKSLDEIDKPGEVAEDEAEETPKNGFFKKRGKSKGRSKKPLPATSGLLGKMTDSGLLVSHPNNRMRFLHPVLGGYLAGRGFSGFNADEVLLEQKNWTGKMLAMHYLAAHGDASNLADSLLEQSGMPLHQPLFVVSRWLRDAPAKAPWRKKVFSALVNLLKTEGIPMGLRAQAVAAFCWSADAGVKSLFRQYLQTTSFELVQLAAIGCGAIQDSRSVEQLTNVLQAPSISAQRAACLALVAIGDSSGIEAVARALLQGGEDLRRAAAESLANDATEGHGMLKEGITHPDVMLRHAVVYGLARVGTDWATEALEHLQVEDDQWVVRNSASEILESRKQADPRIPQPLSAPSETPWLVEFAGKQGVGISPGSSGTEVLIAALKSENEEERLAALPYLRRMPSEGVITGLYQAMYQDDPELREAIFLVLCEFAARGIKLPDPRQVGIG